MSLVPSPPGYLHQVHVRRPPRDHGNHGERECAGGGGGGESSDLVLLSLLQRGPRGSTLETRWSRSTSRPWCVRSPPAPPAGAASPEHLWSLIGPGGLAAEAPGEQAEGGVRGRGHGAEEASVGQRGPRSSEEPALEAPPRPGEREEEQSSSFHLRVTQQTFSEVGSKVRRLHNCTNT